MPVQSPVGNRATVATLLTLTVVAGLVDGVSYVGIGHVFIALTTGNVIFLGLSLDPRSNVDAVMSAVAILAFLVGALIGGRAATHLSSRPRLWLGSSLAGEAFIVGCVAVLSGIGALPLRGVGTGVTVVLLAVALGIQTTTVRRLGSRDLPTTVLTMAMAGVIADSPLAGGRNAEVPRRVGSIVCMMAGAAVSAVLLRFSVVAVPLGVAASLVAIASAVFGFCPSAEQPPRRAEAAQEPTTSG
jgi:uncharacterized membrane protein YoaK (UPF0700 family)